MNGQTFREYFIRVLLGLLIPVMIIGLSIMLHFIGVLLGVLIPIMMIGPFTMLYIYYNMSYSIMSYSINFIRTNFISTNTLDWGGFVIGVMASVWRSFNMGYVKETYILSSFSHLPIIYNSYVNYNLNVMVRNIFYTLTSIIGYIRWARKIKKSK